jgi:endonuclease YncB( thermonuclease family)
MGILASACCSHMCFADIPTVNTVPYQSDGKMIQLADATYDNTPMEVYHFTQAKVVQIYDGDTFWIVAWHNGELTRFSVRLFGVDCSEMKKGTEESRAKAQAATMYVTNRILNKIIKIQVLNNTRYDVIKSAKSKGRIMHEKFGRLLSIVTIDGSNLAEELIERGLAYRYYGGKKRSAADDDSTVDWEEVERADLPSTYVGKLL